MVTGSPVGSWNPPGGASQGLLPPASSGQSGERCWEHRRAAWVLVGLKATMVSCSGFTLNGLLPAQLIGIRFADGIVPGHPVDQLGIEQVDVYGMRVHAVMRDLPDLSSVSQRSDRSSIDESLIRSTGRSWNGIEDEVLVAGRR